MTHNGDFPPSKNALNGASELLQRLKMDVFRHSLRKFVARVDKRYNAFHEFSGRLEDYWQQQPESDKDAQNTFETAAMGIRIIKRLAGFKGDGGYWTRLSPYCCECASAACARSCEVSMLVPLV